MQPQTAPQAQTSEPDPLEDWKPEDIQDRLGGGNVRWSAIVIGALVIAGALGLAYWLYQRPASQAEASAVVLEADVDELLASLSSLQELNEALVADSPDLADIDLTELESAARRLFEAGGSLPQSETQTRYLATGAASSALDGVRLAGDARAYLLAVSPILAAPELETDPSVIELDDAVRAFGEWQLRFDDVRTALPDAILPSVTERLDVLSGDLADTLSNYIDALRNDDPAAVEAVMTDLSNRLSAVNLMLEESIAEIHTRVADRVAETRDALGSLDLA